MRGSPAISVVLTSDGLGGLAWGDRRRFVAEAVRSVLQQGGTDHLEVVVVHGAAISSQLLADLRAAVGPALRLVPAPRSASEVQRLNLGVVASSGEVIVLLDEHTEVNGPDFLAHLVGRLDDEVGLTGPRVLRADGRLLDAGLAFHGRRYTSMFEGWPHDVPGPDGLLLTTRECSGLGQTCLALRRSVFDDLGGLCERFPLLWHVDLARKVSWSGLGVVWVSEATMYRVAPAHVDPRRRTKDAIALRQRWHNPDQDAFVPRFGERALGPSAAAGDDQRTLTA